MSPTTWHIPLISTVLAAGSVLAAGLTPAKTTLAATPVPAIIHRVSDLPVPVGRPSGVFIQSAEDIVHPVPSELPRRPVRYQISDEPRVASASVSDHTTDKPVLSNPLRPSLVREADPHIQPIPSIAADPRMPSKVQIAATSLPTGGISAQPTPEEPLPIPMPTESAPPLVPAEVVPVPEATFAGAPDAPLLPGDRPIGDMTANIAAPTGTFPTNAAADHFTIGLESHQPRPWDGTAYFWDAPALCYRPLRYEDINLERYGYTHFPILQPAISGGRFVADTIFLPYDMTVHSRRECIYILGHYRPGSPVPFRHHWPEWDLKAAAVQGAAVTGLFFVIP
jgi:hypothetical protein